MLLLNLQLGAKQGLISKVSEQIVLDVLMRLVQSGCGVVRTLVLKRAEIIRDVTCEMNGNKRPELNWKIPFFWALNGKRNQNLKFF